MHDVLNPPRQVNDCKKKERISECCNSTKDVQSLLSNLYLTYRLSQNDCETEFRPKNYNENQNTWGHGHNYGPLDPTQSL